MDGTLFDSGKGIATATCYAMKAMGRPRPGEDILHAIVGPPLRETFPKYFGLTYEETEEAVALYREFYSREGYKMNVVYPGIVELTRELSAAGKTLCIATAKPQVYADKMVPLYDFAPYIREIAGTDLTGGRQDKAEIIGYLLRKYGIAREQALMVGDRYLDVWAARDAGIPCIGAGWGYGSREELMDAGAACVADTPQDLLAFFHGEKELN